jgi:hypothetical protein
VGRRFHFHDRVPPIELRAEQRHRDVIHRHPARGLSAQAAAVRVPVKRHGHAHLVSTSAKREHPRKGKISGFSPITVARIGA